MPSSSESLALLEAAHTFPGPLQYKVIGEATPAMRQGVCTAVRAIIQDQPCTWSTRHSASGRHCALTLVVHTLDAQQALQIFAALAAAPGVRLVL